MNFFWFLLVPHSRCLHRSRPFFWVRLDELKKCYVLFRWVCLLPLWRTARRIFVNTVSLCRVSFVHVRVCFQANPAVDRSSFAALLIAYLMSGWVCPWNHSGSTAEVAMVRNTDHSEYIHVTPRASKHSTSILWDTAKPQDKACSGSELRHLCLRSGQGLNATSFIHVNPTQSLS